MPEKIFPIKGLSKINREGIDAIREAIRELERAGYVTRTRVRNEKGQLGAADYVIHEFPVPPKPILENPTLDKPISENPTLENPMQENPTQLNKELLSKELSNTDLLNTHSIPILSTPLTEGTATPQERKGNGYTNMDAVRAYEEVIKDNIEYRYLIQDSNIDKGMECLVADKAAFQKKYKDIVVDTASVEDIMLFYVKGGPSCED